MLLAWDIDDIQKVARFCWRVSSNKSAQICAKLAWG